MANPQVSSFVSPRFSIYAPPCCTHILDVVSIADNAIFKKEVFLLIQENLKNKVAELDEDNWMYEIEDEIRV